jgi:hypothetical protein
LPHSQTIWMMRPTRASSARTRNGFQMRTATTEIVCEGRVLILGVSTHKFCTSSEEKRQSPSSKEGEKRVWGGASEAVLYERLQTEKESQHAPSHASGRPFEVKKKKFYQWLPTHAHRLSNSSVFSHLTSKDIIHLSRTSRVFRDTLIMKNATSVWKAARE